ncbi:MAG TPA: hypothetical protein DCY42_02680 [Chloroflexi bacterium]|nr:hypothetical protein [Chloroflexota bacterium]
MKEQVLRLVKSYQGLLILLIFINIVIGLIWVTDFGISIDETEVYEAAFHRFKAYRTGSVPEDFFILNKYSHGAGYYVVGKVISEVFERIFVNWTMFDQWHFTHFLFFQLGGVFIFMLANKMVSGWASLGAVILFFYQPVLWGHAFINPKDTPFMTLMLGALVLGIYAGDQLPAWMSNQHNDKAVPENNSKTRIIKIMHQLASILQIRWFLPTAVLLALCSSTRVYGLFVWVAIGIYWVFKAGKKAIIPWISLLIISGLLGFALWPDLWSAPKENYLAFWSNVFSFSGWNGKILFAGDIYNKTNYPRSFLPVLLSLKFTEPLMILFLIGLIGAIIWVVQKRADWVLFSLLAIWFFGPILLAVIFHPTIYNNIRHFLFILPPIFIFAAIGLEILIQSLKGKYWRLILPILVALPGIFTIIQLHPMEYIYFNRIAGGVEGAFREYELDYWRTSYREAAELINSWAPHGAAVGIYLNFDLIEDFLRDDFSTRFVRGDNLGNLEYLIISTNLNYDQELEALLPQIRKVDQVERYGVPLTVIYEVLEE